MTVLPDLDGLPNTLKHLIRAHLTRRLIVAAFHIPLLGSTAEAAKVNDRATDPAGVWLTQSGDAKVKVQHCGGTLCGRVVWLKEPIDKATGKPQRDDKNADPGQRDPAGDRHRALHQHAAGRPEQMGRPDLQRRRRQDL